MGAEVDKLIKMLQISLAETLEALSVLTDEELDEVSQW